MAISFSTKLMSRVLRQISAPTLTTRVRNLSSKKDQEPHMRPFGTNHRSPDDNRDEILVTTSGDQTTIISSSRDGVPRTRSPADLIETYEGIHIRIVAHGLSKEDVKVTLHKNVLVIKAGAKNDSPTSCKFESSLDMSERPFKIKEVQAELRDGMLYVEVAKVKDEA